MEPEFSPYPRPVKARIRGTPVDRALSVVYIVMVLYGLVVSLRSPGTIMDPTIGRVVVVAIAVYLITTCVYVFQGYRLGFGILGVLALLRGIAYATGISRNYPPLSNVTWWLLALIPYTVEVYALLRFFGLFGPKPPPSRP
jgi:hypothetical protein